MKKHLLFIALWATMIACATAQTWEQGVPLESFNYVASATYHPNYGYLFGGGRGVIWRVNNDGVIDTLYNGNLIIPKRVDCMAFSGDTLFFNINAWGFYKMKIGESPELITNPDFGSVKGIVTKGNKRWISSSNGLFYFDGTNYIHNSAYNSQIQYMDVNNSEVAFIVQNGSLMSVFNNQYTLITDTIVGVNYIKVNPVTNELHFSTPTQLYKLTGSTIVPIEVVTNLIDFSLSNKVITNFSFSKTEDRIFILYRDNPDSGTSSDILVTKIDNEYFIMNCPNDATSLRKLSVPIFEVNYQLLFTTSDNFYKLNNSLISANMLNYNIIDKGAFRALINSDGMLFWNRTTGIPLFEFPKNSRKNTAFSSTLWLAGINQNNDTCVAATRYNQVGYDFWAGPVAQNYDVNYQNKYDRVWKMNRDQINTHITDYQQPGYTMPSEISKWPAHGDISNGEAPYIAPFFDSDQNGTYEPQNGDYPIILGQQAAYFIFSDTRLPHTETGGTQLGVEVHGMAYVMDSVNMDLKNTLFVKYNVFNRLNNDFTKFYLGKFDDLDLGSGYDDFVGCDSLRNTFYIYNGDSIDGYGHDYEYSKAPPVQGVTFLNNDMSQFVFLNNSGGIAAMNDPDTATDYFTVLEGFWKDRTPYTYGGDGYGAGTPVKFMFSGNPLTSQGWSEVSENNPTGDRRGLASAQLSNFNHGTNYCLDIAYVYNRDCEDTNTCNHLSNIPNMLTRVDSVQQYFNNHELSCTMNSVVFNANTIPDFNTCTHAAAYVNNSQLNYSMSIDSVQLFGITGVTPTNVKTSWRIYQSGNVVTLTDIAYNVQDNVPVVLSLNIMHNPNTHTMNAQTIQYFSAGLVGIQEISEEQIVLFPNPTKGNVRINGVENVTKIEIYNMLGQESLSIEKHDKSSSMNIDLSNMKRGVYFVKIIGAKGTTLTKKLVLN